MLSAKTILKGLNLMSNSYFTRKLLNIKDKNITFPEDYLEEVKLNGVTSFIFKGILSYHPTHCEHCSIPPLIDRFTVSNSRCEKLIS